MTQDSHESIDAQAMAYIEKISPDQAEGVLKRIFQARSKAAGRLWEIIAVQSLTPETLRESLRFYGQVMFGKSALTRAVREMIAVVTSQANECHY
ncbi:MAG: carboxymuconolactone decarboxylase family protein [Kofleriaceae bacterium]|nr:carboxymuconolactone decarboxylase family protein [Kofleriaceae bacterium]